MKNLILNTVILFIIGIVAFQAIIYTFNFVSPWIAFIILGITILALIKFSNKIIK